jgi:hypothetical protein
MKGAGLASDGSALMRAACKNAVCSHSSAPVATVRLYRSIGSGESVAARFVSSMLIAGPGAQSREGSDEERLGFCPFQLPEKPPEWALRWDPFYCRGEWIIWVAAPKTEPVSKGEGASRSLRRRGGKFRADSNSRSQVRLAPWRSESTLHNKETRCENGYEYGKRFRDGTGRRPKL